MNFSCLHCQKICREEAAPFLCQDCLDTLTPSRPRQAFTSLYAYNETLRPLVLKIKLEGNYRALQCLTHLFLNSRRTHQITKNIDVIIPAPSSLWARARGRTDLAWLLASSLADKVKCPLHPPPLSLRWQWKKRSKTGFREKLEFAWHEHDPQKQTALIVDDIVTTGHTFQRTSRLLGQVNTHLLTLGDAYSRRGGRARKGG